MKKQRKHMSPETKENLKTLFTAQFSNQKAIDGARHNPWWVALIFLILSICLPVIPMVTSGMNQYGSSFLAQNTYGFDTTGTAFVLELNEKDVNLVVDENHRLVDKDSSWKNLYTYEDDVQYNYTNSNSKQYDLLVYYTNKTGSEFTELNDEISKRQYIQGTTDLYVILDDDNSSSSTQASSSESSSASGTTSEEEEVKLYTPNYILMNKDYFVMQTYSPNTITKAGRMSGDYLTMEVGTNVKDIALVNGKLGDIESVGYTASVYKNWKSFINESFISTRNYSTMYSSLLSLGIFAALELFLGLMVFLLTRGKKNMFHILSFLTCEKITAWASLCPAILSMIVGFIIPSFAMMSFICLLGLRIMWLSMKQLRPQMR